MSTDPANLCPVMLFSGKGGVGKTTLAAATAVRLAAGGAKILTMSTDPAHSLSDAFGVQLGARPIRLMPGLDAMELDAKGVFMDAVDQLEGSSRKSSTLGDMMRLVSQTPGVDEFGAIEVLMEIMERAEHDVVILDTAPTGHTLRLLMLPDLLDSWMGKLLEMKSRLAKVGRLFKRLLPGDASNASEEDLGQSLEGGRQRIGSLRDVLSDPDRSQIFLVTIPEAMSVLETQRTMEMLASASMPVASVIVNQLQPDSGDCLHCKRRRNIHLAELEHMRSVAGDVPMRVVEALPWEICGLDGLQRFGELVWEQD
ncbi:MAG: ArsA family ATPase [Deltaproteobacteria bacterium]|nr:ArsA family ATPase [Deltaproteobacteria bacterium]